VGDLQRVGGEADRPGLIEAAKTAAALSALFMVVYNACNWITSHRSDVGTWYFQWELAIPFVPIMILPYMSIDLFFVAAPFLCGSRMELAIFRRRITCAILVAGAFFLLMPLKLGFERQPVAGWLGVIFNTFLGVDPPYNLFPSLHITLRTILARLYVHHTRGLVQLVTRVWFSLIGFSTVLTHQHQLVDVAAGFLLAGFCFYLFNDATERLPVIPNRRVGFYYGLAAAVLIGGVVTLRPWGTFLIWPVVSVGMVTAGYFGLGPGIYRKLDARLPLSTRFALAPVLLGQQLSLVHYRRQCRPWDEVLPHLWIGRVLNKSEAAEAIERGVTGVLDLTAEFAETPPFVKADYLNLPILDLTAPTRGQLDTAVAFISKRIESGTVYVHCKIGYSRTAAVVGAYLLASGQAQSVDEAIEILRRARPSIVIRPEARQALVDYSQSCRRQLT
jgi:protein-tyrosine phosphatase/membrane-associated phospholipid phosphatase